MRKERLPGNSGGQVSGHSPPSVLPHPAHLGVTSLWATLTPPAVCREGHNDTGTPTSAPWGRVAVTAQHLDRAEQLRASGVVRGPKQCQEGQEGTESRTAGPGCGVRPLFPQGPARSTGSGVLISGVSPTQQLLLQHPHHHHQCLGPPAHQGPLWGPGFLCGLPG